MVEKGIRGGIYAKAINKYMKDDQKNKNSLYLKLLDVNNS